MDESDHHSAVFPVVLFDGERELNVGNIKIDQTLDFKQFQLMLKQTVGISYNNLTTYLVDSKLSSFERRKILITGKANFSFIVRETNSYFLVVLKRSRRDRRKKRSNNKQNSVVCNDYLLQIGRNQFDYGYGEQIQKYMNMVMNWNHVISLPLNVSNFEEKGGSRALCKDCREAEKLGEKPEFHFCVYDDVVAGGGFRSPVGPISRPQ